MQLCGESNGVEAVNRITYAKPLDAFTDFVLSFQNSGRKPLLSAKSKFWAVFQH